MPFKLPLTALFPFCLALLVPPAHAADSYPPERYGSAATSGGGHYRDYERFERAAAYRNHPNVYYPERFSREKNPTEVIEETLDKITDFTTHADSASPRQLRAFIEREIIPHFDFDNMSHWITGPYAQYMSDEEKRRFQKTLRETFLSSLAKHLGSFNAANTRIKFSPPQYRGVDEAFVRTRVYQSGMRPMRLNFRMRRSGDDWKVIDVRANGASAVLYYRRHFMSQLRQYKDNY